MLFLPQLKRCSGCQAIKVLEEFNRLTRSPDGRQWNCRACNAKWHADHKEHHNKLIRDRNRRVAEALVRRLWVYKFERGCADCRERDPTVLEFDCLRDKEALVSVIARKTQRWSTVLEEVEKCDVVCANCHRRRTARRAEDIRWRLYLEFRSQIERVSE